MTTSLEGKFVFYTNAESWRTGCVKAVMPGAALVQFDQMNTPDPSWSFPAELVCMEEIMHAYDGDIRMWGFFDTRAELDAYIKWLDAPSKSTGRVVKLVGKK